MGLNSYKAPLCMVDGVEFSLDNAPEIKVTVRMPIPANKQFSFGWAKRLPMSPDGKIDASPFDVVYAQRSELFASQIIKIEGVKDTTNFWNEYPLAEEEIWDKVQAALPKYRDNLDEQVKN